MENFVEIALLLMGLGAALVVVVGLVALGASVAAAVLYGIATVAAWAFDGLLERASALLDRIEDSVAEWRDR